MYEYRAKVLRLVDGDTVDAAIDLGFGLAFTARFRLAGLNTPERGQAGGAAATEALRKALYDAAGPGGYVACRTDRDRQDKYGRYLITFFDLKGASINQWLLDNNLAVPYTYTENQQ